MFLSWIIRNGGNHTKTVQNGGKLSKSWKRIKSTHLSRRIHAPEPFHAFHAFHAIPCNPWSKAQHASGQPSSSNLCGKHQLSCGNEADEEMCPAEELRKEEEFRAVGSTSRLEFLPFRKPVDWIIKVVDWFNMSTGWGSLRKSCRQLAAAGGVFSRRKKHSSPENPAQSDEKINIS